MRSIMFAVVVTMLAACAPTTTSKSEHTNVAVVRGEIKTELGGDRAIVSMGKVTPTSAEVYTEAKGAPRKQELWVKAAGRWKLQGTHDVAAVQ